MRIKERCNVSGFENGQRKGSHELWIVGGPWYLKKADSPLKSAERNSLTNTLVLV
jgi:hypothetical protein